MMYFDVLRFWFLTLWERLFHQLLANVASLVVLIAPVVLPQAVYSTSVGGAYILQILCDALFAFFVLALAGYEFALASREPRAFSHARRSLRESLLPKLLLALLAAFLLTLVWFGVPYYSSLGNLYGGLAVAIISWIFVFGCCVWLIAVPAQSSKRSGLVESLKTALLFFMDNALYTLFVFLVSIVILAVSLLTLGLFPGVGGLLLWHQIAYKFRALRYSVAHDDEKVDWKVLFVDENAYWEKGRKAK